MKEDLHCKRILNKKNFFFLVSSFFLFALLAEWGGLIVGNTGTSRKIYDTSLSPLSSLSIVLSSCRLNASAALTGCGSGSGKVLAVNTAPVL
jgi:hypothetical protein